MRCTIAAQRKLAACAVNFKEHLFNPADISTSWSSFQTTDAQWRYMDCRYHTEQNGMTMHSYVFIGGQLLGDGFDIMNLPCSALSGASPHRKPTKAEV